MSPGPILAFDLGGTRLKAALVVGGRPGRGTAVAVGDTFDATLGLVESTGRRLLAGRAAAGVALAVPGLLDGGAVSSLPGKHAGIEGFPLQRWLSERFGAPAVIVNDAVAYALGEACSGAGAGFRRVVAMTIGTGVGTAVVEDGRPVGEGLFGGGLLGGQIPISAASDGALDSNGRPDSIEALCCAARIVDRARANGAEAASVEDVYRLAAAGDSGARAGVAAYRGDLIRALVAVAHAHAPDVIVVGGGPLAPGNPLLPGLEAEVNARLFKGYRVRIRRTRLGARAALAGAAALLR